MLLAAVMYEGLFKIKIKVIQCTVITPLNNVHTAYNLMNRVTKLAGLFVKTLAKVRAIYCPS